jgi:antitoxin (DNA-binding transcriptional repressor) of toxin-antitoxin stability system
MITVNSRYAKTYLNALLRKVSKGETVQITVRGVSAAKLSTVEPAEVRNPEEAARTIRALRTGMTLGNFAIRELIDAGRQ